MKVLKRLRAYENDWLWIRDHLGALHKKYRDRWIAVKGQRVLDSDRGTPQEVARLPIGAPTDREPSGALH